MFEKLKKNGKLLLITAFLILGSAGIASAQDTDAIDDLVTDSAKIEDVEGNVTPVAVATIVFGSGAMILKRLIYA